MQPGRIKRIAVFAGKGCLGGILCIVLAIASMIGIQWLTSQEDVTYVWDSSVENTSGISRGLYHIDGKHRGVSLMAENRIEKTDLDTLVKNNIEWVAVHPYAIHAEGYDAPALHFDEAGLLEWGIRDSALVVLSSMAKESGVKIFLKPHVWLRGPGENKWRSEIEMNTEADWQQWFSNYSAFILHYASLADSLEIEMFSIGTELQQPALLRESDWRSLIKQVRTVYKGKLVYSANWHDEYEFIKFWDALDAIGVQAYFPLTKDKNPSIDALIHGWQAHKEKLRQLSKTYNKPVIFTELGYKSSAGAAIEPWEWLSFFTLIFERMSVTTQARAYEAFFEVFWHEPWFEGVFIWRWTRRPEFIDVSRDRSFYIQRKPAQNIVAKGYAQIGHAESELRETTQQATSN